jgi:GMP synthase-like glutamine amidotransferase
MQLLVFQHSPDSPAGLLAARAAARGIDLVTVPAWNGAMVPADAGGFDGLVLLGGAMNALDDERCPHFPALLRLAQAYAASGRPVLGICLGAQLLARAFGGKPRLAAASEFGWTWLHPTPEAADDPVTSRAGPPCLAFAWHDDSFALPKGAVRLFEGVACREQGFRIGRHVYGFQFHFEATPEIIAGWLALRARNPEAAFEVARVRAELAAGMNAATAFGCALADGWLDLIAARRG